MILTYIEWRNESPWWFLSDRVTLTAVDGAGNEYSRRYPGEGWIDTWRRSGHVTHPHLALTEPLAGPGCERHQGDPHNLCQACWTLEPE